MPVAQPSVATELQALSTAETSSQKSGDELTVEHAMNAKRRQGWLRDGCVIPGGVRAALAAAAPSPEGHRQCTEARAARTVAAESSVELQRLQWSPLFAIGRTVPSLELNRSLPPSSNAFLKARAQAQSRAVVRARVQTLLKLGAKNVNTQATPLGRHAGRTRSCVARSPVLSVDAQFAAELLRNHTRACETSASTRRTRLRRAMRTKR
eukprot:3543913-Pleurochrysis_carterae.AAC.1